MKKCISCGEVKTLDAFHRSKDSRQRKCKLCVSHWHREYNSRPEIKAAKAPRVRAYNKVYRANNLEKSRSDYKIWRVKNPVQSLGKSLRRALRRRPTENHVTVKELVSMFNDQAGRCALSDVKMTWGLGAYFPTSISIDRIDSSKGYTKDNVRLLCYAVNAFKGVWGDDHVIAIAKAIANKHNPEQMHWIESNDDDRAWIQ